MGECKHVGFNIDDINTDDRTLEVSINDQETCPQKIEAIFTWPHESGNTITKRFATVLNQFPFKKKYWTLISKKYANVKKIEFHMKNWYNAQGSVKVGFRQFYLGTFPCRTVEKTISRGYLQRLTF